MFNKIENIEINKNDIGITTEIEEKLLKYSNNIINIALFGVDSEEGKVGRSDSIIIETIDAKHKKLKLTSIMRDSYVNIDGVGKDKINHAYDFGGPQLAIKTLNENFDLNISKFLSVNFTTLPKIIDMLGGLTLDITNEEVKYIPGIGVEGRYKLNGSQALAYSRIRYASGGDYVRTDRQRAVLSKVLEKIINMNKSEYASIVGEILPMLKTNLKYSEIINLVIEVFKIGLSELYQERFLRDG